MKVLDFKRISKSDIPDSPVWVDNLLSLINNAIESCVMSLRGNLTFNDNIVSEQIQTLVDHNKETQIILQKIKYQPRFVLCGFSLGHEVESINIIRYDGANIPVIKIIFKDAPSYKVQVNLLFF